MIQELFEGSQPPLPSPSAASLYPLPPNSTKTNNPIVSSTPSSENPRCPRCDSSNTKFCYYNNYNLTQPRHFCKSCRRYWTKGGALRNVPIGGGCRKNKTTTSSISASFTKSNAARILKTITSSKIEYAGLNHEISPNSNPIYWTAPQTSHLFSFLREKQVTNPNPSAYPVSMKGEDYLMGNHMSLGSILANTTFNGTRSLGLITPSQTAPFDLVSTTSTYFRNNHQQNQSCSGLTGDFSGGGLQEMSLQRIRSTTNCYPEQNGQTILGNVASSTCMSSSAIIDSAPMVGATDTSFLWGNSISWCDSSTTSGPLPQGSSRLV